MIKEKKESLKFWENNFMDMRTFKIYKNFVIMLFAFNTI